MGLDLLWIGVWGAAAAWLSQSRTEALRRWASVFGLAGLPWWFHAAWAQADWRLLAIAMLYLAAWLRGAWVHWRAPQPGAVDSGLGTIQITPGR